MTGDDHAATAARPAASTSYAAASPAGCDVADWECVRVDARTSTRTRRSPTPQAAELSRRRASRSALHVNTNCANYTPASLDAFFDEPARRLGARSYPSLPPPDHEPHPLHRVERLGRHQPKVELAHGIRLDTNYYYWPRAWVQNRPGFFTGSGMPMRFADLDGDDDRRLPGDDPDDRRVGPDATRSPSTRCSTARSAPEGYYGAFTANMHTDTADASRSDRDRRLGAGARRAGRLRAADAHLARRPQRLDLRADRLGRRHADLPRSTRAPGANGLRGMLPVSFGGRHAADADARRAPVTFTRETIKGVAYALFPANSGAYTATYAADTTAPRRSRHGRPRRRQTARRP